MRLIQDLDDDNLTRRLSVKATSHQVLTKMHRPWLTLACILLAVLFSIVLVNATVYFLVSPLFAATQVRTVEHQALFDDLPDGWRMKSEFIVPPAQREQIAKRLGGAMVFLSNNVVSQGDRDLQVNVMTAPSVEEADKLFESLTAMKGGSESLARMGDSVIEFVIRNKVQARMAVEAKYALNIQSRTVSYNVEFTAVPIASGDSMQWNRVFNLFLEREQAVSQNKPLPPIDQKILKAATSFKASDTLELASRSSGNELSRWEFSPEPVAVDQSSEHSTVRFRLEDLPTLAQLPIVRVKGAIRTVAFGKSQALDSHQSLTSATEHWPTEKYVEIRSLATQIMRESIQREDQVKALLNWFVNTNNIRFGGGIVGSRYGVARVLQQRYGHCWDYSDLFITLARARGIPSRQVLGWIHNREGHVWCEVLVDGHWRQVDPTTGMGCGSDYIPFVISDRGWMPLLYASSVKVDVVE